MKVNRSRRAGVVLIAVSMLTLVLMGMLPAADQHAPVYSPVRSSAVESSTVGNINWHDGSNQTTPLASVTYTEQYSTISQPVNGTMTQMGLLQQYMWIEYKDGTGARVGFELHCVFNPGGINVSEQKVLNWSKLQDIELILHSETWEDNRTIGTMYSFQGFNIISGNPDNFSLSNGSSDNSSYHIINNLLGSISYWAQSARIGNVTLSTGNNNESVATFNVSVDANINNDNPQGGYFSQETEVPISTVFQFTVTHNLTETEYKYGADINWSAAKEFPTELPMAYGQNYSLVASDLLMFYAGGTNGEVKQFTTDASNDTAVYEMNNTTMCTELFTKNYTIDNGTQVYNTTRIYVENDSSDPTGNVSKVYMVFGGFSYGKSFKLSFDPAVITPNSLKNSTGSGFGNTLDKVLPYIIVVAVIAIAAVVALKFRRR